ncbi:helix-turn-helix domain-containing protein [Undibacterium sp.]|jgi:Ner family transcriptional regulator|uniref:helix-turn-helix domain-containing protein n=1 Tax=Undibacterium sp. TaxID=1914977 RepID=UPI002CBE1B5D|nr:helix-turn-helix domain-containing protein [Undibacterium sp.]HTD05884.1 helix-turn-helix domain-containing protein [Undibacterium sp.]
MSALDISKKAAQADMHRADVVAALHKKGWSLRELSRQSGLSDGTLKSALDRPYLKAEGIIAAALDMAPQDIWPQRYAKRNFTPVLSPKTHIKHTQNNLANPLPTSMPIQATAGLN